MKALYFHIENIDTNERVKILGNHIISIAQIEDSFLRRANKEGVQDEKVIKMLNYFNSWDSFQELESYWFWFYDPRDPNRWLQILDHIYKRSITPIYLMN